MDYHIELRQVEPQLLAVVRDVATANTLTAKILGSPVWTYLSANGIRSSGHNVVVYHHTGKPEFAVEIGADIEAPFEGDGTVVCSATPGGIAATTRHIGPYSQLATAYAALDEWIRTNGHRPARTSWEVYGHWNDDPAKLETDIFQLLQHPAG